MPNSGALIDSVVYCSICSFMLGYHVHEKAILIPIVLSVLSLAGDAGRGLSSSASNLRANLVFLLSLSGIHGVLPLFNNVQETPIKCLILISSTILTFTLIKAILVNWTVGSNK